MGGCGSLVIFVLIFCGTLSAQTTIPAGNVNGIWTAANSPYQVQGLIVVQDGQNLTIEPGTTIEFAAQGRLRIKGNVLAMGTSTSPILMTASNISNGWKSIYLDSVNVASDSTIFENCTIEYGKTTGLFRIINFNKVRVESCTLQEGSAFSGGCAFLANTNAIFKNNLIQNNVASSQGGGFTISGGVPEFIGNTITNNDGSDGGGAFRIYNYTDPILTGNIITNNDALTGGAIMFSNFCDAIITGNTFDGNTSTFDGAVIWGGSINPIISNNSFTNNVAGEDGGVYYFFGNCQPTLINNYYQGNQADRGGAVYLNDNSIGLLQNEVFVNNSSVFNGGAVYLGDMTYAKVEKCIFSNNLSANSAGGALYTYANVDADVVNCNFVNNQAQSGAAVYTHLNSSPAFNNCTFVNNLATSSGGAVLAYWSSSPIFTNCIFKGNSALNSGNNLHVVYFAVNPSSPEFVNCDIEGGVTSFELNGHPLGPYLNNIEDDPQFITPSLGAGNLYNGIAADWQIGSGSPCFNKGTPDTTGLLLPSTDLNGANRIVSDTVDIGAYEIVQEASVLSQSLGVSLCTADSIHLWVNTTGIAPVSYQWQLDGTDVFGETSDTILVVGSLVSAGNYTCIVSNSFGTDTSQLITVDYFESPTLSSLGNDVGICAGDSLLLEADNGPYSYNWNDGLGSNDSLVVFTGGNYYYSVVDTNSCASVSDTITITENVLPVFDLGSDIQQCGNDTIWLNPSLSGVFYDWNNGQSTNDSISVDSTGMQILLITDINGCSYSDSVNITFYPTPIISLPNDTLCDGETLTLSPGAGFVNYNWNNGASTNSSFSVTSSGDYIVEVIDSNGCSGSDTSTIVFNPTPIISLGADLTICNGDSVQLSVGSGFQTYDWNNGYSDSSSVFISTSGPWVVQVTNSDGCSGRDSLVTTVLPPSTGTDIITECESYTWIDGNTYTSNNNTATYLHTNVQGCDSIVTLDLIVNNSTSGTDVISECFEYTWIDGVTYYGDNDTSTYLLTNSLGCDSIVTLDLTITSFINNLMNFDPELIAPAGMSSYQWLDCNNNYAPVPGETGSTFTATQNGLYAVQLEQNGCLDTTICALIDEVNLLELQETNWTVFPNPTSDIVTINFNEVLEEITVEIMDPLGQIIQKRSFSSTTEVVLILGEEPGLYFVQVMVEGKRVILPIVKL